MPLITLADPFAHEPAGITPYIYIYSIAGTLLKKLVDVSHVNDYDMREKDEMKRGSLMASAMLWIAPRLICSLIKDRSLSFSLSLLFALGMSFAYTRLVYPLIAAIIFSEFDINAIQPGCRPKVPGGSPVAE